MGRADSARCEPLGTRYNHFACESDMSVKVVGRLLDTCLRGNKRICLLLAIVFCGSVHVPSPVPEAACRCIVVRRTTNSLSKYAGYRDKMLGMELRLSKDGTRQWARHIASGFTFTVRQCTPLDPRIGHTSAAATPGELSPLFPVKLVLRCLLYTSPSPRD